MTRTSAMNDWVAEAQAATVAAAVQAYDLRLKGRGEMTGPCPVCGGTDRFGANVSKNVWNCRSCGVGGHGGLSLACHIEGGNRGDAFKRACQQLNGTPPPSGSAAPMSEDHRKARDEKRRKDAAQREADQARDRSRREQSASQIWNESYPLGGIGHNYLRSRGIDPKMADQELRLHNGLAHPEGGSFPAVVCRILDAAGSQTGIWRIFIKPDGSGKAPVENAKLGLGSAVGGAVRIGGLWPRIGIAEGVETALAARQIAGGIVPVWAALSTSGMAAFEPPEIVEHVTIYADGDAPRFAKDGKVRSPGIEAANKLAARLTERRIKVTVCVPPAGSDWLDCLNALKGRAA